MSIMQPTPQDVMELQASSTKLGIEDGDVAVPPSSPIAAVLQKPLHTAKKPTRQWAAWTRQEEENFFNALRQVGKNFEKITCRVQSKNKDQVRHYYYRLVRRMNKLLGPEFGLDAKNSKDTIAAMLRWWSLLEKYSCTASKLHLKPRRFKTFIEALAHQLLKDRNKTRRKRPSHDENYSFVPTTAASILSKGSGSDAHPVKLLFLDNQKSQKVGSTKATSLKGSISADISCNKGAFPVLRTMKQSRRTGLVASAAYKRWEKAALAGVSLVADAAEQLERTTDGRGPFDQTNFDIHPHRISSTTNVQEDKGFADSTAPMSTSASSELCSFRIREICIQPFTKLKLQLFPVDEITRKTLEKDEHNPYLELTLSARKRISSILEHLNRKWGNSSIASGELMLFPYDIQLDDVVNCQRWTLKDKVSCAADVYGTVGRPAIFRLRYGWFSDSGPGSRIVRAPPSLIHFDGCMQSKESPRHNADTSVSDGEPMNVELQKDKSTTVETLMPPFNDAQKPVDVNTPLKPKNVIFESLGATAASSLAQEESGDGKKQQDDEENLKLNNASILSAGEWADSLTNVSIGDLLSEASRASDSVQISDPSLQNVPFSCDSFDAAIAAHISGRRDSQNPSNRVSNESLWDAEETCDGFSFQMIPSQDREDPNSSSKISSGTCRQISHADSVGFHSLLKNITETEPSEKGLEIDSQSKEGLSHNKHDTEGNMGPTDLYWTDSLGALDLEIPSSRYLGQDLIFGESISLSGLSRLIANSLDAFQNLSFFGPERAPSATQPQEETPLSFDKQDEE